MLLMVHNDCVFSQTWLLNEFDNWSVFPIVTHSSWDVKYTKALSWSWQQGSGLCTFSHHSQQYKTMLCCLYSWNWNSPNPLDPFIFLHQMPQQSSFPVCDVLVARRVWRALQRAGPSRPPRTPAALGQRALYAWSSSSCTQETQVTIFWKALLPFSLCVYCVLSKLFWGS